jgi:hypothetical protein
MWSYNGRVLLRFKFYREIMTCNLLAQVTLVSMQGTSVIARRYSELCSLFTCRQNEKLCLRYKR